MKIVFARKDKKKAAQAATPEDLMMSGIFGDEILPADSILVLDEDGRHVGFLTNEHQRILLSMPVNSGRKFNNRSLNLKKVGETKSGWGIYALPKKMSEWVVETPEDKKAAEAEKANVAHVSECIFDAKMETITNPEGQKSTFLDQIDALCSIRPWRRPLLWIYLVKGIAKKVKEGHKDANDAMAFLNKLAKANDVPVNVLASNPGAVALLGKGAVDPTALNGAAQFTQDDLNFILG